MPRFLIASLTMLTLLSVPRVASAHFPWLATDADGKVIFFFGEHHADRTYKLPPQFHKVEVHSHSRKEKPATLSLKPIETEKLVGLVSDVSVKKNSQLSCKATYGLYMGTRLEYYAVHLGGKLPRKQRKAQSKAGLTAQLVDTETGVDVYVHWNGKPKADVKVKLYCDDGHEEGAGTTDEAGKISFTDKEVEDGLNGITVGFTAKEQGGTLDGKEYQATMHYLTVTFHDPQDFEKKKQN